MPASSHRDLRYQPDSVTLFTRLRAMPYAALLHSGDHDAPNGRYDIMAADPRRLFEYRDGVLRVDDMSIRTTRPLETLRHCLDTQNAAAAPPHFRSGFIGFFGYALQHTLERLPTSPPDPTGLPDLWGGDYLWSIVTDHVARTTKLWCDPELKDAEINSVLSAISREAPAPADGARICGAFEPSSSIEQYRLAFAKIQNYISSGDCYQVNLARHYRAPLLANRNEASWHTYQRLVRVQPGPFGAYLTTPHGEIACVSPERFVRLSTQGLETTPIKGTAARRDDAREDARVRRALADSPKNRAENLMIVDLLRNDLGRLCKPGTIRAQSLFDVQSFSNVHHLVSTIAGQPEAGVDAWEVLAAIFPGGSITGAPKVRAMQVINELESVGRSVYCGSVAYLDRSGLFDSNIAIRTMVFTPDAVHCWGGGAIVADSDVDEELAEIDHKIGRMLQVVAAAPESKDCNSP